MAKQLVQVVIAGMQVVGRAFARAVRQEYQASQQAAKRHGGGQKERTKRAAADTYTGMSLQEAKEILNMSDIHNVEELQKQYDHLFDVNDKSKGGSLYLQSKVVRAKERVEMEVTTQSQSNGDSEKSSPDS